MTDEETIICRPTRWFLWRALAMVGMFGFFCGWFLKDWKLGYPKENLIFHTYQAFETAKKEFAHREEAGQSAAEWEAFAKRQKIPFPREEGLLPPGVDPESPWPDDLRDYAKYKAAYEAEGNKPVPPMWLAYSNQQAWDSSPPEHGLDAGKIRQQLYWGIGAGVLTLIALFYLFRTKARLMMADAEGFYPPGGGMIPYGLIHRIDKRKWETKGLAYVFYKDEEGVTQKSKVDGMVYGQFREEDGAPAERLFRLILRKFSGELIELEPPGEADGKAEGPEMAQADRED